ncbi:MAG: hypothetical protein WD533_07885, partial [Dehalococcoidia bacterium]
FVTLHCLSTWPLSRPPRSPLSPDCHPLSVDNAAIVTPLSPRFVTLADCHGLHGNFFAPCYVLVIGGQD